MERAVGSATGALDVVDGLTGVRITPRSHLVRSCCSNAEMCSRALLTFSVTCFRHSSTVGIEDCPARCEHSSIATPNVEGQARRGASNLYRIAFP
jgi:hypothetical protein